MLLMYTGFIVIARAENVVYMCTFLPSILCIRSTRVHCHTRTARIAYGYVHPTLDHVRYCGFDTPPAEAFAQVAGLRRTHQWLYIVHTVMIAAHTLTRRTLGACTPTERYLPARETLTRASPDRAVAARQPVAWTREPCGASSSDTGRLPGRRPDGASLGA